MKPQTKQPPQNSVNCTVAFKQTGDNDTQKCNRHCLIIASHHLFAIRGIAAPTNRNRQIQPPLNIADCIAAINDPVVDN